MANAHDELVTRLESARKMLARLGDLGHIPTGGEEYPNLLCIYDEVANIDRVLKPYREPYQTVLPKPILKERYCKHCHEFKYLHDLGIIASHEFEPDL